MSLNRSTYYKTQTPARKRRAESDTALRVAIEHVVQDWPAYGYRRVTQELRRRGIVVNHKRVSRIMREHALTVQRVRRFIATTDSRHDSPIYPNIAHNYCPIAPDALWVSDITYIRLRAEFVYLAVILDAWSRRVVGYAISRFIDTRLTLAALEAAIADRKPPPGLVHHSDRGSQYAAKEYRECLARHGILGSMSRKGNPYDNAQAESFMKTLKHEEVYAYEYESLVDVIERLPRFIDQIYNRRRLHSALGYCTPEEHELNYARRQVKC
jgi:putative transposase